MRNPKARAWTWLVVSCVVIGAVLFLSAGTIRYWRAWVYLAVIAVGSVPVTLFMIRNPALLESRTRFGPVAEQRPVQRLIVLVLMLLSLAIFVVPGLDHRFGWSTVPMWLSIAGNALLVASLWVSLRVFKENAFGSSTIRVVGGQKVISTGPYAVVRNPMYSGAILFFVAMSLALGSWWALIPAVLTIPVFIWRLVDEEEFLAENLPGYREYRAKVRWHLIPGIF
jgi:protein-S-isoprenylcysteine O-methyltransferase Ste14